MAELEKPTKRKKPLFLRRDWYKKIKFGKGVKKNQKWRAAKGRQNKTRLGRRGYGKRPKIGYSESSNLKDKVNGLEFTRVETLSDIESLKSGQAILIANLGKRKRELVLEKASEKGLVVLNKYKMEKKK